MMTYRQLYLQTKQRLSASDIDDPEFDARCLFEKATGLNRIGLITYGNDAADKTCVKSLENYIRRRLNHEPLQYILGSRNFYGFDFKVGKGVLIPRDDTEVVVNLCIDYLKSLGRQAHVIDLCAGSGAIGVALALNTDSQVIALELSDSAFEYLTQNVSASKANIQLYNGDVLKCYAEFQDDSFDLIVSNPPYINSDEIKTLQKEVQNEPISALDGGADGCDFYRSITEHWTAKLKNGVALAFELGENQADTVKSLMIEQRYKNIKTSLDLGGTQRAIIGTLIKK